MAGCHPRFALYQGMTLRVPDTGYVRPMALRANLHTPGTPHRYCPNTYLYPIGARWCYLPVFQSLHMLWPGFSSRPILRGFTLSATLWKSRAGNRWKEVLTLLPPRRGYKPWFYSCRPEISAFPMLGKRFVFISSSKLLLPFWFQRPKNIFQASLTGQPPPAPPSHFLLKYMQCLCGDRGSGSRSPHKKCRQLHLDWRWWIDGRDMTVSASKILCFSDIVYRSYVQVILSPFHDLDIFQREDRR